MGRPRARPPHPAPHAHPRLAYGQLGEHRLEHRTSTGDETQRGVARAGRAVGDRGRPRGQVVHPHASRVQQQPGDLGQLLVAHLAEPGEQIVRLPELRHPAPLPRLPRQRRRLRHLVRIRLQHGNPVSVPGQHHRRRQPDHAPAAHHDLAHTEHPLPDFTDREARSVSGGPISGRRYPAPACATADRATPPDALKRETAPVVSPGPGRRALLPAAAATHAPAGSRWNAEGSRSPRVSQFPGAVAGP